MKLENVFHKISCRELTGFKPNINSYMRLFKIANLNFNEKTYFFEDTIENLLIT